MSCPPDWNLGVYVDQELVGGELRELEGHLVGCERCRRRVLDLQAEARLLTDTYGERPPAAEPALVARSAQGLATGVPASLGVLGIAVAVAGLVFDVGLPRGTDWLLPSRWLGVNEMILDVLFILRDRAPGALEFGLAVALTASVAAGVSFGAGVLLRRFEGPARLGGLLLLLVLSWASVPAQALVLQLDQASVLVAADEVIDETLVASGESLVIEGVVKGNVVAFCERVSIRGRVEGEVFAIGREVEILGEVTGGVHVFGEQGRIEGRVDGTTIAGFDRITVSPDARLGGDFGAVSARLVFEGQVARDLHALTKSTELRGSIGRHLEFSGEELEVTGTAAIGGHLAAHVPAIESVRIAEGARVTGERRIEPDEHMRHMTSEYRNPAFYLWRVVWLAAAFGVGLLLHLFLPALYAGEVDSSGAFFRTLGLGLAVVVLTPLCLVLVALTVVGLPVALIGLGFYVLAWYVAGLLVAFLVGQAVLRRGAGTLRDFGLALLAGLVVLAVAYHLPWLGGLLRFLGLLLGYGLLADAVMRGWRGRPALAA